MKIKRSPKLQVSVEEHHIENAILRKSKYCMIAEAIKELYPQFSHVAVDLQSIRMTDRTKGVRYIYLTPRVIQKALVMFDKGIKMRPISFKLQSAQTVAAQVTDRQTGQTTRKKLGRRRAITDRRRHPDIVGGKPPPRQASPLSMRHPSSSGIREFGVGAFTDEERATWPPKGTGLGYNH